MRPKEPIIQPRKIVSIDWLLHASGLGDNSKSAHKLIAACDIEADSRQSGAGLFLERCLQGVFLRKEPC